MQQVLEGFRLSPQQQRLWSQPGDRQLYRAQCMLQIDGDLQVERLQQAINTVVNRHEILRMRFHRQPGLKTPLQLIGASENSVSWQHIDWTNLQADERSDRWQALLQAQQQPRFQFECDRLLHFVLIQWCDRVHYLLVTLPTLCADRQTLNNLAAEIAQAYAIACSQKELWEETIQYLQFSEWQHELLAEEDAAAGFTYWQQQNLEALPTLTLPFEQQPPEAAAFDPDCYSIEVPSEVTAKLASIAQQRQTTVGAILLTAWQALLWRLTQQPDVVVSTVTNGRQYEELSNMMGLLAKPLPICCRYHRGLKFSEAVAQIQEKCEQAEQWQDYLVGEESLHPLPIGFEWVEWPERSAADGIAFTLLQQSVYYQPFKIQLIALRKGASLRLEFHYNRHLLDRIEVQQLAERFETLVGNAVENWDTAIGELEWLSDLERHQLLVEWNQTQVEFPQTQCFHHLFAAQVERTPHQIAVVFEDRQLTYAELNERANQLAHHLQGKGIQPEDLIGLYLERSLDSIVGLLGILKAGAAYVPLDPELPKPRLKARLQAAQVAALVTHSSLVATLSTAIADTICIDRIPPEKIDNPQSSVTSANLAYVLFTSGSTGTPKGVAIEHQQLLNYVYGSLERFDLHASTSFALISTFAADLGHTVIFPPLCTGGVLHIISSQRVADPESLANYFRDRAIDCLKIVPSHLAALLASGVAPTFLPRRCLILGGEAASWPLIERVQQQAPDCQLFNHYGPTETTVGVLTHAVADQHASPHAQTVPLGRPLPNICAYVLDQQQQLVGIGVPGELYIAGAGLARGYWQQPELTAERFVSNINRHIQSQRLYKTGDRVRYLPNGTLEFLGRVDRQLKIRGFRIEPGEIEAVLNTCPGVAQTAVIAKGETPDSKHLVAYVVLNQDLTTETLRHFLREHLPEYKVPADFVRLEALPLTPNGKIDYPALPTLEQKRSQLEQPFVPPRIPIEATLCEIWVQVLNLQKVGIDNDFFELGGNSLQAMQLVSKISVATQTNVSVRLLLENPTVAKLAVAIESLQSPSRSVAAETPPLAAQSSSQGQPSLYSQFERRSLLSEIATGRIPPVEAAALGYFRLSLLEQLQPLGFTRDKLINDWCEGLPLLGSILETQLGRIALIFLPWLSSELYSDRSGLIRSTLEALQLAKQVGAQTVSLTGLIPSATDYGKAITEAISNRQDFPQISTGHATTSAAVVFSIQRLLATAGRDLTGERVGYIGLGSVGLSTLHLMLQYLPHPAEIVLCDLYSQRERLQAIREELATGFGFRGRVKIALSRQAVPAEVYDMSLIVCATNAPNVLDIERVQPGTAIVDDSAPHCFCPELAKERLQAKADILFTEGGVLQSPTPVHRLFYLPHHLEAEIGHSRIEAGFNQNPYHLTGCLFSSLLSARYEQLQPTVGLVQPQDALAHYQTLERLNFQAAELHCDRYVLPAAAIARFRQRFSNV